MAFCAFLAVGCVEGPAPEAAPPQAHVRCVAIEERTWIHEVTLRGTVAAAPDRQAIVSAQVAGRLEQVTVREGDLVVRDQVIARVEPRAFEDALRQAQAASAAARAAREAAVAAVAREENLYERGFSARQTLEAARAASSQADASVAAAAAQIDAARQTLSRATVRSPLAGVVLRLSRREGEVVDGTIATPILEVADPASLEIAGSVSARDLVQLRVGQAASITFDALPGRALTGHVRTVSPAIDPASGVGTVRVGLDPTDERVPFGLLGTAAVAVGEPRVVLVAPIVAVRNAGGVERELIVCDGGHARPIPVTTGERREGLAEILTGAELGTQVVADHVTGLTEGTPLEVSQ